MKGFCVVFFLCVAHLCSAQSISLALEGEDWENVSAYPVKGKKGIFSKEQLSFGEYYSVEFNRSWTKGYESTTGFTIGVPTDDFYEKVITTDKIHKKQTYYFALADSIGLWTKAFCATELNAKDFNIGNNSWSVFNIILDIIGPGMESSNFFIGRIYTRGSDDVWNLFFDNEAAMMHPKKYVGYLAKSEKEYYTITPHTAIQSKKGKVSKMPFGAAGFVMRNPAGEALAAVSIIDKGIIYLKNTSPEERILLATALSSLLVQPVDLE